MATVPPSKVRVFPAASLEQIAYKSVGNIPTREPSDQYRLGYNVWRLLSTREGTLAQAIRTAGARLLIPETDVLRAVKDNLAQSGISVE